ncbi:MAG: threonine synthase [Firmicutes bacterium]|nr:threonine synthase [Bacillota bacterium]
MKYESTRGSKNYQTSTKAIIRGIAEDKGLYVPADIPKLPLSIEEMKGMTYQQIAKEVLHSYFDEYTDEEMLYCINGAYDSKFAAPEVAPIVKAGGAYFLELYHGKTAAFKDMALSILPYLMTTACKKEGETDKICILTATSGDTGKAALEGFAGVPGTEIIVFYPEGGVSQVQERQMVSQAEDNTHVFAIKGNFDDAQTGVKKIFADDEMKEKLAAKGIKLSSANSINIGRLVPQVAYYVYSYVKLVEEGALNNGDKMNVVVPTGNFGNILAAYLAGKMGVPVGKLICASNENKVLTDFIRTGVYDARRDFHLTNSPSMDILISSNLERLIYLLAERDGEAVANWMKALDTEKVYEVSETVKKGLEDFYGGFCTEDETLETIDKLWKEEKYLTDTHTAVAYKVYEDYVKETGDKTPTVIASTASAYKFAESVAKAVGLDENKVKVLAKAGEKVTGFDYVKALAIETGVSVPYGLKDLELKPVVHNNVCEKTEMAEVVLGAL